MDRRARRVFRHGRRAARRGEPGAPRCRRRLPSRACSGHASRVSAFSRRHRARGAAFLGRAAIRDAAPARRRPIVGRRDGVLYLAARRHRRRHRPAERGGVGARRQGRSRRAVSVGRAGAGGCARLPAALAGRPRDRRPVSVAPSVGVSRPRRERPRMVCRLVRRRLLPGVARRRPTRARRREAARLARRVVATRRQGDALRCALVDSATDALRGLRFSPAVSWRDW